MKKLPFLFALALLLGSAATFISSVKWTSAKENYSVTFKGGKIEGYFQGLASEVVLDENMAKSYVKASIISGSINTGNSMRDEHAREANALDTEKYPQILFESTSVEKKEGKYLATGTLSMKGVAKTITIPFTFEESGKTANLKGSFLVNPKEFNIERGGTPDEVLITLAIPYQK